MVTPLRMLMRRGATLVALLVARTAFAQAPNPTPPAPGPTPPAPAPAPVPPGPPPPAPAPAPTTPQDPYANDAVLAEQIAEQLVARAQELLDAKFYIDAKQLAVEALVKSPKGNAAEQARYIIKLVNQATGIQDEPAAPEPKPAGANVDLSPIDASQPHPFDPAKEAPPAQPSEQVHDGKTAAMVHGVFYGGVIGATVGVYAGGDKPASVAVPLGIATGIGAGFIAPHVVRKLKWTESQVRTAGSLNLWGGVIGGMFGDAVTGAGSGSPTARGIMLGASIGSTLGMVAGGALAANHKLTRGDVALVDTLAGIGTVGGLTLGMLMQPAQPEAYAVNAIIGAAGGIVIGVVAAPNTNTTPRRMLRVAGLAAAGGAAPFLLYAAIYDKSSHSDEQLTGLLSTAGLLAGAYLGFRLTKDMDVGLDLPDKRSDDAPAAAFARNSNGSWSFGGIGLMPLDRRLSSGGKGLGLTLMSGAF